MTGCSPTSRRAWSTRRSHWPRCCTSIVLGGQAGSEKMRDWARRELNGYAGEDDLPDYRKLPAPLLAQITNDAGYNPMRQRLYASDIPDPIRDTTEWEIATMNSGIGELEAYVARDDEMLHFSPGWSGNLVSLLNHINAGRNSRVAAIFWEVPRASLQGLLVRVRTALAELVAELESMTPDGQAVPDKAAADQAVQFVVTGDRATINYTPQRASGGGSNSVTIGAPATDDDGKTRGLWRRWRKPGALIVGMATIGGTVVGVLTWLDWTPW
ncbi:hypothetical protein [Amycolatopsis sp. NPDC004169]|uniref:AbiTii domain-containing protein n=1 Tax=Amycolatopsis sp. NPDC004169 TaxID=3154453 RepID=UPI0033A7AD48